MCEFLSVNSDGKGKIYYFDWKIRKKILAKKLDLIADSHTSIATYFKKNEDKMNKYEYNPLTKEFIIDQTNVKDDSEIVEKKVRKLDFKKIVPKLIIKPIINPFDIEPPKKITAKHIKLLKQWNSVWNSVRDSVGDSVWNSVWNSVRDSVRNSVRNSVWNSVGDSVWNSVWNSVRDSVGDSVEAYTGSFFDLKRKDWKYTEKIEMKGYPFQSAVDLWNMGLVPSFDGKVWRLHGHKDARILFKISAEDLRKKKKVKK